MAVSLVDVQLKVPKEGKELCDALCALVAHFKSGKSVADALALLPQLSSGVDGIGSVVEEIKSDHNDELVAYMVTSLWGALKAEKAQ